MILFQYFIIFLNRQFCDIVLIRQYQIHSNQPQQQKHKSCVFRKMTSAYTPNTFLPLSSVMPLYQSFKQQLLQKMITYDPLAILQCGIFEEFESYLQQLPSSLSASQMQGNWFHHRKSLKHNMEIQKKIFCYQMETKISRYQIDEVEVGVLEKRSHSSDFRQIGHNTNKQITLRNRLRKQQENRNIDLVIFSNIMNNHFNNSFRPNDQFQQKQNKNPNRHQTPSKISLNPNSIKLATPRSPTIGSSSVFQKSWVDELVQKMTRQIVSNPSKQKIKVVLRQFLTQIEQENDKIISQLNKIRKQNDRLTKNLQENSMKQLQYIVQIKHMDKKNMQKEQQIQKISEQVRNLEQELRDREGEYARNIKNKIRQIEQLQNINSKKSYIEDLKQKLAIDSIRRTTLRSLNWQKFQIQLQKQELAITANSTHGNSNKSQNSVIVSSFRENEFNSEQTREDDA